MLNRTLIAAVLVLGCGTAQAAGKAAEKGGKPESPTEAGQYVNLATVALPIVSNGKVVNYAFVAVRILLTSSANAAMLRTREPYFRDALIRAGHRTPFSKADDLNAIDVPKLQAALFRDAQALAGPGNIQSISVTRQTGRKWIPTPQAARGDRDQEVHP